MQIRAAKKSLRSLPAAVTRVVFVEKGAEQLVRQGKVLTLEIVCGKLTKLTPRSFRMLIRTIVHSAHRHKLSKLAFEFDLKDYPKLQSFGEAWAMSQISENLLLANYTFTTYKSKPKKTAVSEVTILGNFTKEGLAGLKRGIVVGESANLTRDVANTPGRDMTPQLLGEQAKAILKGTSATVRILNEKEIEKLGMGGILGVGQGACDKPRFIIIEYWGSKKPGASLTNKKTSKLKDEERPIVFVGKGVTFDTGGLQVKPGMSMYEMHMDMSGGAAVIGAIAAIAKLGLKKNVIGLIPAVENAVSDRAVRPGDVLKMMSGKTVDVLHTDAEGRIILADALHYARRYEPKLVVDIATLTGASLVALGQHAHAIMTKDRAIEDTLRELGEESGDYTFPLPLWDEYLQYTKGVHGDISNVPHGDSRAGGVINGGMFLSHFTDKMPWVHIDMAPRMTAVQSDKLAKGATGEPTRLLVKIAEKF